MQKTLVSLGLTLCMILTAAGAFAADAGADTSSVNTQKSTSPNPAGNPIDQLTGKIWQQSLESNKESILFGIDLGVAANYFAAQKAAAKAPKKGKNSPVHLLSHFDRCWIDAFKDLSRAEAVKMIDAWYAAHPDQLSRPVLSVIWNEIVVPRVDGKNP